MQTLTKLLELCATLGLSTFISTTSPLPDSLARLHEFETHSRSHAASNVTFLLNFSQPQRTALLQSKHTIALLYTPTNEHFGIGPVEGMVCGLPVIACESGGPVESIVNFPTPSTPPSLTPLDPKPTGFLAAPTSDAFTSAVLRAIALSPTQRIELAESARARARAKFGMDAMSASLEEVLNEAADKGNMWGFMQPAIHIDQKKFEFWHDIISLLCILAAVLVYFDWL